MEQITNIWVNGIDKDLSKNSLENTKCLHIENMRITTDIGQSTKAEINVRGNSQFLTFPSTSEVYKVVCESTATSGVNYTFTLNSIALTFTTTTDLLVVATQLNAQIASNVTLTTAGITAVSNDQGTSMLIYSTNGTSFTATMGTSPAVAGLNISQVLSVIPSANIIPIGFTVIRDNVFWLTTPTEVNTDTTTIDSSFPLCQGTLQIWKMAYNLETFVPTLTLLYNNLCNVTTYHPIAPSAIEGRYENSNTQRIYWTDNFNQFRSFNTVDPNGFALEPNLLDREPPVDMNIPILQKISNDGNSSLPVGVFQATYRLKNDNTKTQFLPLSNPVYVTLADEGGAFEQYIEATSGSLTNKRLTYKISNIDTDFERIEICMLYRGQTTSTPDIRITHDEPIPADGILEFSYTGKEFIEDITLNDFLNAGFSWTHCKTIVGKDNRLVVGNVRLEKTDFTFDSRAYRFDGSSGVAGTNNFKFLDTTEFIANYNSDFTQIPETADAITFDETVYRWNPDTKYLGGKGPNINYEFGTHFVKADSSSNGLDLLTVQTAPFRASQPNYQQGEIDLGTGNEYSLGKSSIMDGMKNPYHSSIFKGYLRNETYRFAIQFFDKQGRALFAKWIGDIKMPDYQDICDPNNRGGNIGNLTAPTDFRLMFHDTAVDSSAWLSILYVKFNVNLPTTLKQYVSGWQIVRCERTDEDKSILGTGTITPVQSDGSFLFQPNQSAPDNFEWLNINAVGSTAGTANEHVHSLQCPDFLHGGYSYQAGDTIKVIDALARKNSTYDVQLVSGTDPFRIVKYYTSGTPSVRPTYTLAEGALVEHGAEYKLTGPLVSAWTFKNYDNIGTDSSAIGNRTIILSTSNTPSGGIYNATSANSQNTGLRLYVSYNRPNTSQYGGNTYSIRTRNVYIPCGDFQYINEDKQFPANYTHKVFGGDIFTVVYDNQKLAKNGNTSYFPYRTDAATLTSFTEFFPAEVTLNTELRSGQHPNKDFTAANQTNFTGAVYIETFNIESSPTTANNIVKALPKPLDFVSTDEYDARIWISEAKINGENKDSWAVFKTNNWRDCQSELGPINALVHFKNNIYYFQDRAYGVVPINQRAALQDNTQNTGTTELVLGNGELISNPIYMSTKVGTKHQWSVCVSPSAIAFFNMNNKSLYTLGSQGEQTIEGLDGYFTQNLTGRIQNTDNPVHRNTTLTASFLGVGNRSGITAGYDYRYDEFVYTFIDSQADPVTLLYSEHPFTIGFDEKAIRSFYTFYPSIYVSDTQNLFTSDPDNRNKVYLHDEGNFGRFYNQTPSKSKISFIVNPLPRNTKIFENFEWLTEVLDESGNNPVNRLTQTWDRIRVYTDSQNSDYQTLTNNTNVKRKERRWQMQIPRNVVRSILATNLDIFDSTNFDTTRLFKDKMRDFYLTVDLEYNNSNNYKIVCPFVNTLYQVSSR